MINWHIRKAELKDADELQECMLLAYSEYEDRINVETLPPLNVDYKDEISSFPVWVVEVNNNVIAGLILSFEEKNASLANIAIHPDFQGKGLGKFLLNFAEKEAITKGYSDIHLATHALFTENVLIYNKLGWVVLDQDETKVYMKKYLR
ncbi:GNAT family N-acetyltransferase [Alkalihalobacillus macyae]|uniref:GNAT family N-acetyltransferase n=1 Tax=Guptibacillus hwajinpoensis TaxID=208199 RepID=UPI00273AE9E7|nr:GNAT family N-acetyltransferase [Alkalihalobacillus macyae]MDP4550641.1 GNAT family N-acetyltransferase [Alkalihalobacillus macyae]